MSHTASGIAHSYSISWLKPSASAVIPMSTAPTWMARSAKMVLQLRTNASRRVALSPSLQGRLFAFEIVASDPGRSNSSGSAKVVPGMAVSVSRAAAATTVLKVDPGA